jgi:hypothetical protein
MTHLVIAPMEEAGYTLHNLRQREEAARKVGEAFSG